MSLLQSMLAEGVDRILFSSSAAVYGRPDRKLVDEDAPTAPANPYGRSKLVCEQLLRDAAAAHSLSYVSLRYFNAAGAGAPDLVDRGVTNLVPLAFQALSRGEAPLIFGDDYPTADGTCVRDFIHVSDLADAHLAAARRVRDGICRGDAERRSRCRLQRPRGTRRHRPCHGTRCRPDGWSTDAREIRLRSSRTSAASGRSWAGRRSSTSRTWSGVRGRAGSSWAGSRRSLRRRAAGQVPFASGASVDG